MGGATETGGKVHTGGIDRCHKPSYEEFEHYYLRANKPVILTGCMDDWPAMAKWSPEFFKREYGAVAVTVAGRTQLLADFIDLVLASTPEQPAPYLKDAVVRRMSPELMKDIEPFVEYCFPDWLVGFYPNRPVRHLLNSAQVELFLGGRGTRLGELHYDYVHSHTVLCQVFGRKEFTLFAPRDTACGVSPVCAGTRRGSLPAGRLVAHHPAGNGLHRGRPQLCQRHQLGSGDPGCLRHGGRTTANSARLPSCLSHAAQLLEASARALGRCEQARHRPGQLSVAVPKQLLRWSGVHFPAPHAHDPACRSADLQWASWGCWRPQPPHGLKAFRVSEGLEDGPEMFLFVNPTDFRHQFDPLLAKPELQQHFDPLADPSAQSNTFRSCNKRHMSLLLHFVNVLPEYCTQWRRQFHHPVDDAE
jgi:hypothetical protein